MKKFKYFLGGFIAVAIAIVVVSLIFGQSEVSASAGAGIQNSFKNIAADSWVFDWFVQPIQEAITNLVDKAMEWIGDSLQWSMTGGAGGIGDGLLIVWTSFLPIANVLFAVVFLIMIYSTATGAGLSNYSIKKIMPRLIIVAVAINVSYYLCAALADLSNIIGANIDGLFPELSTEFIELMGERYAETGGQWTATKATANVVSFVAGVGILIFIVLSLGTVLVAVLTIFLSIAARYVILFMLVAIAPVAIACAVLPQTESLFKKWLDMYVRMLIVYPLFMIVWKAVRWFQNSGMLEMMSQPDADGNINPIGIIISILLPIVPALLIQPIFKASGGLMGKMSGAIQKGVGNSFVGKMGKNADDTLRGLAANVGNKKEIGLQQHEKQVDKEYEKTKADLTKNTGYGSLKEAEEAEGTDSEAYKKWQRAEKNYDDLRAVAKENDAAEDKKAATMNRFRFLGAPVGIMGQFTRGETGRRWEQYNKDRFGADEERRTNTMKEAALKRQDGKSALETANMRRDNSAASYKNAVEEEKLSAAARDTAEIEGKKGPRAGRLYGQQTRANALKQESDGLNKELGADAEMQAAGRINLLNRARKADVRTNIYKGVQDEFTDSMNAADINRAANELRDPMNNEEKLRQNYLKALKEAQDNSEKYKTTTLELETEQAGVEAIQANINSNKEKKVEKMNLIKDIENDPNARNLSKEERAEIDNEIKELDDSIRQDEGKLKEAKVIVKNKKEEQAKVVSEIKQSEPIVKAQQAVDSATREVEYAEARVKEENATFRAMDSAKRAANAKDSYEAAVSRASRGLTSEVDAQMINEIKQNADARLEMDKSQRLAESEPLQDINLETRATKERTVNLNRAVNVDYANKIKENPIFKGHDEGLATYAGGGGVADIKGTLRQSDELAKMQSMGAAYKVVDSDWAERSANIKSFLENTPSEARWHELNKEGGLIDTAVREKNTAVLAAITEFEKGKGQIGKMQQVIDNISSKPSFKTDAELRQFVVSQNIKLGEDSFIDQNYAKYVGAMEDMGKGNQVMARKNWLKVNSNGELDAKLATELGFEGEVKNGKIKISIPFVPLTDITSAKVAKYDKDSMEQLAEASSENFIEMQESYGTQNVNGNSSKKQTATTKTLIYKLDKQTGKPGTSREVVDKILSKIKPKGDTGPSAISSTIEYISGELTNDKHGEIGDIGEASEEVRKYVRSVYEELLDNPSLRGETTEGDIYRVIAATLVPKGTKAEREKELNDYKEKRVKQVEQKKEAKEGEKNSTGSEATPTPAPVVTSTPDTVPAPKIEIANPYTPIDDLRRR